MLTIRNEQRDVLASASFEAWLLDHARRFFAAECAELGPDGTLTFIREMVQRARRHGLRCGPEISGYLDLGFTFGRDFESHAWAAPLVAEADGHWSAFTIDALYEAAMEELEPEAGFGVEDDAADQLD